MSKTTHEHYTDNYFKAAQSWDTQICASLQISKNRAWLVSFFCMGVSVLSLTALILLLPLKSFAPYVVTVERDTGYVEVTKGLYAQNLSEEEAITQSNLVRYVSARESYNPATLRENFDFVALLSDGAALKEFKQLWDGQNPDNPSKKFGKKGAADIRIKSVSLLNNKTAAVRFMRITHENEQITETHWSAIITFQYVQTPMKMADRFSNPLGFQVTNYRTNPEGLEQIK